MTHKELIIPGLRGFFGDWVYYSCLITLDQLAARVEYAEQLHSNRKLSQWIQRSLEESRGIEIAHYLETQPQRFFNSLVIAVYGGEPLWYEAGDIRPSSKAVDLPELPEGVRFSLGFLRLHGEEQLFAIDGQHRLAGIKVALKNKEVPGTDEASVLLVAHKNDRKGMERTRRLFTTLNKTPRHVTKRDIIALDEDDVMAITVRRLVEGHDYFAGERIAFNSNSNLHREDTASFTSIVALYDVLQNIFRAYPKRLKSKELCFKRPDQKALDQYYELAVTYFEGLAKAVPELGRYMNASIFDRVGSKMRGPFGGNVIFRPVGLILFARLAAQLLPEVGMKATLEALSRLPTVLNGEPYVGVLWSRTKHRMITDGVALTHRLLRFMLGEQVNKTQLKHDYAQAMEQPLSSIELPTPVSDVLTPPAVSKL
jgi:DNA sulfur modification protein DndB